MKKQFWLIDDDPTQVSVAFQQDGQRSIKKLTLWQSDDHDAVSRFLTALNRFRVSRRFDFMAFASRFWEMPLLVFANRPTAGEVISLVNRRQQVLTSLDSPFKVINHYPELWNSDEVSQLSDWQHNEFFLDIRTLDGRIDHGELSRYERYLCQAGYPLPTPDCPLVQRLRCKLDNLRRLFNTPLFQECWFQHQQVMQKYQREISKDPREKWAGMMIIMPTTTDAETIEAILYRDHHIHDRSRISIGGAFTGISSQWGRRLLDFYRPYDGIDRHDPYALRRVHLQSKDFRPPLIANPDGSAFVLLPSEGGIHGFTVQPREFLHSPDFQQINNFSQPNHARRIFKLDRPMINQELLLKMKVFDPHAQAIVEQMVANVNAHESAPSLMSKLDQKLLHALKGSSDTSFDNHLKQPNTILQMRLTVQLKLIQLCELLVSNHFTLLSVNSTIVYIAAGKQAPVGLLGHLPDGFHITDQGRHWFAKSPNDHVYWSDSRGCQVTGDNVNHYHGPNNWTDQQRPTITETVLVEYLMKHGNQAPIDRQAIAKLLQHHLDYRFNPDEWFQPILSSKLKQIFAVCQSDRQVLVANPVLRGFFTNDSAKPTVTRIFTSQQGPSDTAAAELAKRARLTDHFHLTRHFWKVEQRQIYTGRHVKLVFDPATVSAAKLKTELDLDAYTQIVAGMLTNWLGRPETPTADQLALKL